MADRPKIASHTLTPLEKLSPDLRTRIRARAAEGSTKARLRLDFNISATTVIAVLAEAGMKPRRGMRRGPKSGTAGKVQFVLSQLRQGRSLADSGRFMGVSRKAISALMIKRCDPVILARARDEGVQQRFESMLHPCSHCGKPTVSERLCSPLCTSQARTKHKDDIHAMMAAKETGRTWSQIAEDFGLKTEFAAINAVRRFQARADAKQDTLRFMTEEEAAIVGKVIAAQRQGRTWDDIAKQLGCNRRTVQMITEVGTMRSQGLSWAEIAVQTKTRGMTDRYLTAIERAQDFLNDI